MKAKEDFFGALFEKTPNAISYQKVVIDAHGVLGDYEFIGVNRAFERLFNIDAAEIVGKKFSDFYPETDEKTTQWLQTAEQVALHNKTITSDCYVRLVHKWMRLAAFPLEPYCFGTIYTDITKEVIQENQLKENHESLVKLIEELQKANALLQTLATMDELTGVYNRNFFDRKTGDEMERADRYNEPLSLIVFDLDCFKHVNDTWGHPVGDEVLKQVAAVAGQIIRNSDMLNRLGGEEFAVLMPKTTLCGALTVAEKLRKALADNLHPSVGQVTASFGVAERKRSESFKSWYKRADAALYRAKNSGRNCVVECSETVAAPIASVRLEWQSGWESGNQAIDEQHRQLLALANNLINISFAGVRFEQVMLQLDRLLKHIDQHFYAEEKILTAVGYPEVEHHVLLHKKLIMKALQIEELYKREGLQSAAFFSFIIDDVVLGHMLKDDVLFFPYMKQH